VVGSFEDGSELLSAIRGGEFLDKLNNYYILISFNLLIYANNKCSSSTSNPPTQVTVYVAATVSVPL
jgi:hypothetical protein